MKTVPPSNPQPGPGLKYWRSLDELADTPAFRAWLEREFPAQAQQPFDPVSRRHFLKLMSASFLLAGVGLTGCRRPEETIVPFSKMPENYVHGVPQYFATAMPDRHSAIPLLVKSSDGRPTKIEGNPQHPASSGGTDTFAQAAVLNLYDPDRSQRYTRGGTNVDRTAALDFLTQLSQSAGGGQGMAILLEASSSPTRSRLQSIFGQKLPQARWFVYEPVDLAAADAVASEILGQPVGQEYHFDQAKVIVSLEADFLGTEAEAYRNIRGFSLGRCVEQPTDSLSRLYAVESLMTLTGANADHRLRVPASAVIHLAARLVLEVFTQSGQSMAGPLEAALGTLANPAVLKELSLRLQPGDAEFVNKWLANCARDLAGAKGQGIVMAGHRQPKVVQALAYALNYALGNLGKTVGLKPSHPVPAGSLAELARLLQAGQVNTLVVLGGNPAYNAPADLDWAKTQRQAKTVVRLGYYEDETFAACDWHLPAAHFLESWGDARTADGTITSIQPLLAPLFEGLTELEVLARLAGLEKPTPYELVRETFKGLGPATQSEESWKRFLHDGFWADSAPSPLAPKWDEAQAAQLLAGAVSRPLPAKDNLELVFHRDYSLDDGRFNNNGWLQEMPDPITKMTWDNAVLLSRRTASELHVKNNDLIEIQLGERRLRGPVWVQPGMADYSLGLALGYGRTKTGRVGRQAGYNAYPLRTVAAANIATGARITPTGLTYSLSCTQEHWSMESRPIIREATLKQFAEKPDFAKAMDAEKPPSSLPLYPNPLDTAKEKAVHQWGLVIDLNRCVGCSACVMACQSENNIPIVGKDQVRRGREMHWIRLDRYYAADPAKGGRPGTTIADQEQQFAQWIDDPQVVSQPMMCQHCEAAPCENVCPVNATVHDEEGLNVMAYNRCVGTRYCSNNCPFKVRRFNFFDYNKRPIQDGQLYRGPLARKPADEWELMKLVRNPDVTVRMRGVMEKCTFCVQRIEQAKIAQKIKARGSADVEVPDGNVIPACAQACPAEAIVFGNVADPNSRVAKAKAQPRNYSVLDFLNVKPRTTYLARVRNPNPAMPDAYEAPSSAREIYQHNGSHEHGHRPEDAPPPANPAARRTEKGGH